MAETMITLSGRQVVCLGLDDHAPDRIAHKLVRCRGGRYTYERTPELEDEIRLWAECAAGGGADPGDTRVAKQLLRKLTALED